MRHVARKPASADVTPYQEVVRKWMESDAAGFTKERGRLEKEWRVVLAEKKAAYRAGRVGVSEGVGELPTPSVVAAALPPDEKAERALALCRRLLAKMSAEARGEGSGGEVNPPGVPPL